MPYFVQNVEIKSMDSWISGGKGESCALFNILCSARGIRGTIFMNKTRDCAEHRICDKTFTVFGRTTGMINDKNRPSITDSAISMRSAYFRRSYCEFVFFFLIETDVIAPIESVCDNKSVYVYVTRNPSRK